jgi:uncharacterized OsmC-like protein
MAVEIKGQYKGDLRVELTHGPSKCLINTDAPVDNNGKGESFSPTDLVVSALGACMVTIMGIIAKRDGISLNEVSFRAEKHMAENPRRIGKIILEIKMPSGLTDEQKKKLERAAHTCPVHQSLRSDIEQDIKFIY